jgi:hypothetical protein
MSLGIEIDEEHSQFGVGQGRTQVRGSSRLSDAALLIDDGESSHRSSLTKREVDLEPTRVASCRPATLGRLSV